MKSVTIEAKERKEIGTRSSNRIRRQGDVPCVLYGGDTTIHFYASEKAFKPVVYTPDNVDVVIELEGKKYKAILKDIQFHPTKDVVTHLDFIEVNENKAITIDVPVHIVGTAIGIKEGGILMNAMRKITVTGLPKFIPDHIDINVEQLNIGDAVHIADIQLEGLRIEHNKVATVVSVVPPTKEEVAKPVVDATATPEGAAATPAAAAGAAAPSAEKKAEPKK